MIDIPWGSDNTIQNVDALWIKEQFEKNPLLLKNRKKISPYFTIDRFCSSLNETRKQLVINKEVAKDNMFIYVVKEKFWLSDRYEKDVQKTIYSLVGSLLNIIKSSKEKIENTAKNTRKYLYEDLSYSEEYDEILMIMDELIYEFFTSKDLGASISEAEKNSFGEQALDIFLKKHTEDIGQWKLDVQKLHLYLRKKKVI